MIKGTKLRLELKSLQLILDGLYNMDHTIWGLYFLGYYSLKTGFNIHIPM